MTSPLLVKARREGRKIVNVTPQSVGCKHVGFRAHASRPLVELPAAKHDSHDGEVPPRETQLEETCYHRLDPPQGFAFQRRTATSCTTST